jgi:CBS domain-containing protein
MKGRIILTFLLTLGTAAGPSLILLPPAPPLRVESEEEGPLARDLMSRAVPTTTPATPVEAVRRLMSASGISGFPVADEQNRVLGVFPRRISSFMKPIRSSTWPPS